VHSLNFERCSSRSRRRKALVLCRETRGFTPWLNVCAGSNQSLHLRRASFPQQGDESRAFSWSTDLGWQQQGPERTSERNHQREKFRKAAATAAAHRKRQHAVRG
jgi:hypothetical protein